MWAAWWLVVLLGLGRAEDRTLSENEEMIRRKPRATALLLAEVRGDAADAAAQAQADFYIGRCLENIGLLHAAHRQYLAAARGSALVRTEALARLASLAERVGDDEPLIPLAARIPEAAWPTRFADTYRFLRARARHRAADPDGALADLALVPATSPRYPAALLLRGVILAEQAQPDAARDVLVTLASLRLQGGRRLEKAELHRTQSLARLDLGRIYYSAQRYEDAARLYASVGEPYAPVAALEGAWADWLAGGTRAAALLDRAEDSPEAAWLALLLLPDGPDRQSRAAVLQTTWTRQLQALQAIQARYEETPAELWRDWLEDPDDPGTAAEEAGLTADFFRAALRDTRLSGAVVRMRRIRDDLHTLDQQPEEWRAVFEAPLREQLALDEDALRARAGQLLLDDIAHQERRLGRLLEEIPGLLPASYGGG